MRGEQQRSVEGGLQCVRGEQQRTVEGQKSSVLTESPIQLMVISCSERELESLPSFTAPMSDRCSVVFLEGASIGL